MELFPFDPRQSPLPDCLQSLGRLNMTIDYDAAGAMMQGRKCELTSVLSFVKLSFSIALKMARP